MTISYKLFMDNNWSIEQTKELFALAYDATSQNKGLMWAFNKMSQNIDRSVNSVRNYYYSQLKMFELIPSLADELGIKVVNVSRGRFTMFDKEEIDSLVETILLQKANGISVRATIATLSNGDSKLALRLQNKYRSMVTHHKQKVNSIMSNLSKQGKLYYNPYTKCVSSGQEVIDNHEKLIEYIQALDEKDIDSVFEVFKKLFA